MMTLLRAEYRKTRGKYLLLTALAITAVQLIWALYGTYNEHTLTHGWMIFLYQFPLLNTIFIPFLATVIASRLADLEHKGAMLKQLATITDKGRIYDAKCFYGLLILLACAFISWGVTVAFGFIKGFGGEFPLNLYLLYFLFTVTPTVAIYLFQYALSMLIQNQAVPFFIGVLGTFAGVFSLFLPSLPYLREALLWGHYGKLQFVGMFGWTEETKMTYVHYDVLPIDWSFFILLLIVIVLLFVIGRGLFIRKEVSS